MNEATRFYSYRVACVVDQHFLEQITKLVKEVGSEITYKIETTDHRDFAYTDIDKVLAIPNTRNSRIKKLSARSSHIVNYVTQTSLNITVEDDRFSPIHYYISANDEKDVNHFSKRIDDTISMLKQPSWYRFIAYSDIFNLFFAIYLIWSLSYWIDVIRTGNLTEERLLAAFGVGVPFEILALLFLLVFLVFLFSNLLNRIKNLLFPKVVFAIGAGIRRYNTLVFVRNTLIFSGILVPTIVNIIFWIFTRS